MKSKWPGAIAVAIAAQILQLLCEPAQASESTLHVGDTCAAGDCESCGKHKKTKGMAVTET